MASPAITDRGDTLSRAGEKGGGLDFLARCRKRFNRVISAESENRKLAIEDLKFKKGDQWPDAIRSQRTNEKRPCLTINKMKTFVHQITNDQRQNRPAINVSPVGDKADPDTAKMLKGLIRHIERQSDADIAYDTGFDSAVSGGWGYWRILTEYEGEDSFNQVIRIGRIRNPFRVYLDPDHQQPDGSDAQWGFISDMIPREEFEQDYPNADPMEWVDGGMGDEFQHWTTQTHVRIAEYFYFETEVRKLVALATGHIGYEDELADEVKAQIQANPELVVNSREVPCKRIKWCKLSAKDILEENDWPGKWIPIVKVIGDEVDVEGRVSLAGVIRDAKDPQRMKNYWATAKTELVALAPKAPWVMEEGQIEGHENRWKRANIDSFPYLLYKGSNVAGKQAPPPQRQQFAGPPTGVIEAEQSAEQDMQATTGIRFDATKHERLADESGKALRELKRVGDLGSFHYVDNLGRSLKHTGRILIDLIPKVYDTARVVTILREDDSEEQVKIDPQQQQPSAKGDQNGRIRKIYNPKVGTYEVAITIGPSFATRRQEAAESMTNFMKVVPNAAPLIGDLVAKNMDWPGAEEIAERLQAMLPPQILQKSLDDIPPEAKAVVSALMSQLEQLKQEHQQAVAMLGDKEADRQIERDKIKAGERKADQTFEASLTKIAADMEVKLLASIQGPMAEIQRMVQEMEHRFEMGSVVADHQAERISQELDYQAQSIAQDQAHAADMEAAQAKADQLKQQQARP